MAHREIKKKGRVRQQSAAAVAVCAASCGLPALPSAGFMQQLLVGSRTMEDASWRRRCVDCPGVSVLPCLGAASRLVVAAQPLVRGGGAQLLLEERVGTSSALWN